MDSEDNNWTRPGGPLSPARVFDMVIADQRTALETIFKVAQAGVDLYQKLMIVSAGMLGLVIPTLTNADIVTAPWRIRRAAYFAAANIALGIVLHALTRFTLPASARKFKRAFGAYVARVGQAMRSGDEEALGAAFNSFSQVEEAMTGGRWKFLRVSWLVVEAAFFVTFLIAAVLVGLAF